MRHFMAKPAVVLTCWVITVLVCAQRAGADYINVEKHNSRTVITYYHDRGQPFKQVLLDDTAPAAEHIIVKHIDADPQTHRYQYTLTIAPGYIRHDYYDRQGLPVRYTQQLNSGPLGSRLIQARVEAYPDSGKRHYIEAVTDLETQYITCNAQGLPEQTLLVRHAGPAYAGYALCHTIYRSNSDIPLLKRTQTPLAQTVDYFDQNGRLTWGIKTKKYGSLSQRLETYVCHIDPLTGLVSQKISTTPQQTTTCYFNHSGQMIREKVLKYSGPKLNRESTIDYMLDPQTGFNRLAYWESRFESKKVEYNALGQPVKESITRSFGPESLRNSTRLIVFNDKTGLPKKTTEKNALQTIITDYDANGCKTTATVSRAYGMSESRIATITYDVDPETGLTLAATEISKAETKVTTYDEDGLVTRMQVTRRYGPADRRSATFTYETTIRTGLVRKSTEASATYLKILEHNDNGIPTHGTLELTTGPADARQFNVTILSAPDTGLFSREILENAAYRIIVDYNPYGIPAERTTYTNSGGTWTLTDTTALNEGDAVGATDIVAASVNAARKKAEKERAEKKEKLRKQKDAAEKKAEAEENQEDEQDGDLPQAEIEVEEENTKPIPITHKRIGISLFYDFQQQK